MRLPLENLLVVVDDIALPFGAIRPQDRRCGCRHNGLKNIAEQLGNQRYSTAFPELATIFRAEDKSTMCSGGFRRGTQTDAGTPNDCCRRHQGFLPSGPQFAMTHYNNK